MFSHMWYFFHQFLETLTNLSIVWGKVYELPLHLFSIEVLSQSTGNCFIFVFSFLSSDQRCFRLSSCFSELLRLFMSSACSASSSTFLSSPLILMHISLKSPSPSSITTSESESGSMHNMTVFYFGLILTCLHGTIACFHSISMISCLVIWSMSWTSPSMGWLNISATSDGTPG